MSHPTPGLAQTKDQSPGTQAAPKQPLKRRLLRYLSYAVFHASVWTLAWGIATSPLFGGGEPPLWKYAALASALMLGICSFCFSMDLSPRVRNGPIAPIAIGWCLSSVFLGLAVLLLVTHAKDQSAIGCWDIAEGVFLTLGSVAAAGAFAYCGERLSANCEQRD